MPPEFEMIFCEVKRVIGNVHVGFQYQLASSL